MNNQERQMLTNAAKAAGLKLDQYYEGHQGDFANGLILNTFPHGNCVWNPYEDDAQCLQLARQLGINIDYSDQTAWKRVANGDLAQEYWGGEWWTTDREAVVAVAALMGEKL